MANRLVVFHADCTDGFTAAWCAWLKFGDEAEYVPARYGDLPPFVDGKDVLIVDFSYPLETLLYMHKRARSIRVLDHHKTAMEHLAGLDFAVFDLDRSGAAMAWDELHGGARPLLVAYVEDRDLWRWRLRDSRLISAYLSSFNLAFEQWSYLREVLETDFEHCAVAGGAILRAQQRHVEFMARNAGRALIGGHLVPFVNCTLFQSELIGQLASGHSFACGWFQRSDGKFVYSLRSRDDFDVSTIAKQYGGGGHPGAAGFMLDHLIRVETV